jgi:hypothetical protein
MIHSLFKKTVVIYIFMGITGFVGMGLHYYVMPRFPAYLYTIVEEDDPTLMYLCGGTNFNETNDNNDISVFS